MHILKLEANVPVTLSTTNLFTCSHGNTALVKLWHTHMKYVHSVPPQSWCRRALPSLESPFRRTWPPASSPQYQCWGSGWPPCPGGRGRKNLCPPLLTHCHSSIFSVTSPFSPHPFPPRSLPPLHPPTLQCGSISLRLLPVSSLRSFTPFSFPLSYKAWSRGIGRAHV